MTEVEKRKQQRVNAVRVAIFIHSQAQQQKWRMHEEYTSFECIHPLILQCHCIAFTYCCGVFSKWKRISFSFRKSRYRRAKQTRSRVQLLVRKITKPALNPDADGNVRKLGTWYVFRFDQLCFYQLTVQQANTPENETKSHCISYARKPLISDYWTFIDSITMMPSSLWACIKCTCSAGRFISDIRPVQQQYRNDKEYVFMGWAHKHH